MGNPPVSTGAVKEMVAVSGAVCDTVTPVATEGDDTGSVRNTPFLRKSVVEDKVVLQSDGVDAALSYKIRILCNAMCSIVYGHVCMCSNVWVRMCI